MTSNTLNITTIVRREIQIELPFFYKNPDQDRGYVCAVVENHERDAQGWAYSSVRDDGYVDTFYGDITIKDRISRIVSGMHPDYVQATRQEYIDSVRKHKTEAIDEYRERMDRINSALNAIDEPVNARCKRVLR